MKITRIEENAEAIITESGERLYELLGAGEALGNAKHQSLAVSVIPPGKHSAAHFHRDSSEILYILEGRGQLQVDGQSLEVKQGDTCLLEPGEVHSLYNTSDNLDLRLLAITAPPWRATDAYPVPGG